MSNIVHDQEVEECLEDLLKKVVENLEVEEEEEEEEEENDESEEFNQQWPVQVGGSLKVLNERHGGTDERFGKGANISVTLDVEIPKEITTSPNAPELFGDAVVRRIQQYAPPTSSQTVPKMGLIFEAEEIPKSVGFAFKNRVTLHTFFSYTICVSLSHYYKLCSLALL
ncbi:hypothetical protein GCK72_022468 [Caenorhabditis remanei]|uniref:Uncharacterized protein n=1 Tax=Caenorhabditis remanei TaxID=31234 RepID=A0A6A5FTV1_CAERE|nr:hypothetical protein GCK72_022468 [Caenorhabditis remanei]KAF1746017.1 hypothetical protein GCK72_022468 [Caenorhabditis remanei]